MMRRLGTSDLLLRSLKDCRLPRGPLASAWLRHPSRRVSVVVSVAARRRPGEGFLEFLSCCPGRTGSTECLDVGSQGLLVHGFSPGVPPSNAWMRVHSYWSPRRHAREKSTHTDLCHKRLWNSAIGGYS